MIVIGSYNTDLTIKTRKLPAPGETIIGGVFSEGGGGKGANQAVAAARAGADVTFVARVGDDALGKEGVRRMSEENINTKFIFHDKDTPTGVAFITVDEAGENSIVVASGANSRLSPEDIRIVEGELAKADVLLVQLESPLETVKFAVKRARELGVKVILNPAPAAALGGDILGNVDVITPNAVEAEMMTGIKITGIESMKLTAMKYFSFGIESVIITLGSKGIFIGLQNHMEFVPAYKMEAIDSTGAGDVFSGALAAYVACGMSVESAARVACAAASISVTKMGAQRSAPTKKETGDFIAALSPVESEIIN